MDLESAIAAQQLPARQAAALSALKQAADMEGKIAAILARSAASVPVSASLGAHVDISA